MKIIIQHLSGSDAGRRDVFPLGRLRIGRDEECEVRLDLHKELEVSSQHAELFLDPERGLCVRDLGSTNGTYVDGEPIDVVPIRHRMVIELGRGGIRLRIRLRRSPTEWLTGKRPAAPKPAKR